MLIESILFYISVGEIKSTCQAVENYLLFYPADETMIKNKLFYSKLPKVQENLDFFTPREVSIQQLYFKNLPRVI